MDVLRCLGKAVETFARFKLAESNVTSLCAEPKLKKVWRTLHITDEPTKKFVCKRKSFS